MSKEIAPRLARNSLYSAVKSVVALALLLLVFPYAVGVLGKDVYGIWALAAVVVSCAQLSDFGIAESVVKYAAEYRAHEDGVAINQLVNTVIVVYLVLATTLGGLIWLVLPYVARDVLLIPPHLLEESVLVFRLVVWLFFGNMLIGVFASLILATQQMGYATTVNIVSSCLGGVCTVVFLGQGLGLRGLIMAHALVSLVAAVLNVGFARRLFPGLELNPLRWVSADTFRAVIDYSWKAQTANIAQLLIFQLDRIFLSRYLGLTAVTYYEVGSNIVMYVRTFVMALFAPMMPAASVLQAKAERSLLVGLYQRAFKFAALIAVPLCLLVVGLAQPFMSLWMGSGFELSVSTLQLLMLLFLINILTGPGVFLLNGMGRPELAMRSAVLSGLVNLPLCLVLVKAVGYFGLVAGVGISLFFGAAYFFWVLHRELPELEWNMYRTSLFAPLLLCAPMALGLHVLGPELVSGGILVLIAAVLGYVAVAGLWLRMGTYLDGFERGVLSGMFMRRHNGY